jgi:hypothetical protein
MTTTSGIIGSYVFATRDVPLLNIYEWDVSETSPIGYRNVVSGVASFVKQLNVASPMEFEDTILDFTDSITTSYTATMQCITFGLANTPFNISNFRFWIPSGTALTLDSGAHVEYAASGIWIPNATLPSGYGTVVPISIPSERNIYRQDDTLAYLQGQSDSDVSQFIYISLSVPSGHSLGRWGQGGSGTLDFRISYDWYNTFYEEWE